MEKDVNEELLIKLPKWVHERIIYLHKEKNGRTNYYHAVLLPLEHDPIMEKVEFHVSGMRELQRQLKKYFRGCLRPGINY